MNGIPILLCGGCRTLFTETIEPTDFAEEYEDYYCEDNLAAPEFVSASLDRVFAGFKPYRQTNRMLDVGFGGAFAMLAGARAGWDVQGVEMSESAVENAVKLGLHAVHGDLHKVEYPDNHFDVIVCSEVLEHVPEPRVLADEMARILRPGGLMWATTPHGKGLSWKLLRLHWSVMAPPEHLQLFSIAGLRVLLQDSGFWIADLRTENLNPFEIVRHAKTRLRGDVRSRDVFNRVDSNYQILETVYSRRSLTLAKGAVHAVLNAARQGDSLKAWAIKAAPATEP